jgi:hypothetical protein
LEKAGGQLPLQPVPVTFDVPSGFARTLGLALA